MKFYSSFTHKYNDKTTLGSIHYSYDSNNKFEIILKTKLEFINECKVDIKINSKNDSNIKIVKNSLISIDEYFLWSLDKIKKVEEINNIELELNMNCIIVKNKEEIEFNKKVLIPIINGKPFGKIDKIQYVEI